LIFALSTKNKILEQRSGFRITNNETNNESNKWILHYQQKRSTGANKCILHPNNAPLHKAHPIKQFLAKQNSNVGNIPRVSLTWLLVNPTMFQKT
jgi:hypothetical protein